MFKMFFTFTHICSLFFIFALLPASYAHAGVAPQLGVNGTPKRSDVKRPSKNQPCGNGVNIASALDTSTAVPASANGDVKVTVLNFNAGADGSRKVTSNVDPSGTGKNFVKMTITINGDPVPKENTGSQEVVAKLPAGTKCTGGSKKNKCLVQFVTTSGFGNCVVVSQGPAGSTSSASVNAPAASPVGVDTSERTVEGNVPKKKAGGKKKGGKKDGKKDGKKKKAKVAAAKSPADNGEYKGKGEKKKNKAAAKGKGGKKKGAKKEVGTRAPRALLAEIEESSDEDAA